METHPAGRLSVYPELSVDQALFGFGIEQVHDLRGEGDVQFVSVGQAGALFLCQVHRGQPDDDLVVVFAGQVQVQFASHHLVHVDGTPDGVVRAVKQDGGMLRPDAQDNLLGADAFRLQRGILLLVERDFYAQQFHAEAGGFLVQVRLQEVHLGAADEAGDKEVDRRVEHFLGRTDLLDVAILHDDDPVSQGHGLGLVVGHVDEGGIHPFAQEDDLGAHLVAQLGVQVAQRFVHQEHLGVPHDGAADGDALALAAGQGLGLAAQVFGDAQDLRRLADPAVDLFLVHLPQAQAEGQVFIHRDVGIEGIVLENHGDIPVLRLHIVHDAAVDFQGAFGDVLQARDHPEGGGFAAAGWPDEDHKFLVFDLQVEIMDRDDAVIVDFFHMFKGYACHIRFTPLYTLPQPQSARLPTGETACFG